MNGDEAVERICAQLAAEDIDPAELTTLSFVTWEEIVRSVVTTAGTAGVFEIEWADA